MPDYEAEARRLEHRAHLIRQAAFTVALTGRDITRQELADIYKGTTQ